MNNVNYNDLKYAIRKSCRGIKEFSMDFAINFDKLENLVKGQHLLPIRVGCNPKRVEPDNIPFLNEYFEKSKLSWFNDNKFFTVLVFLDTSSIDETAVNIIRRINKPDSEDPDNDKVKDIAMLTAYYPCYYATVVSYKNEDPHKRNLPSYEIVCRANKIVIKSSDYQYNHKDFS